jgi:uncharacterized membrane protein YfhO
MQKVEEFLAKYYLLIILVLAIPAIWALFVPGFYGASDDLHIAWLFQMDSVIKMLKFPPRFVPDLSFGFGYPLFNFVFPLPFYIGEIFHLLGLTLVDSIKTVFLLSIPLSMFFMYKLLKNFSSSILSLAGAVVYAFTPYRSTDIYVRGDIGESLSFVFLPIIILSIVKLAKKEKVGGRWIGILGLSTAVLILTHNIIAYMFMPFALLLLIVGGRVMKSLWGMVLGLIISAFFWVPAISESHLMKYDTVFNFIDHFPTLKQLITPYFGYGASVPGPYDGMSFYMGTVNILLIVGGTIVFFFLRKRFELRLKVLFVWLLSIIVISIFMMNFRSTFVWQTIPLLPYFQFPWRFLTMITFASSIFVVFLEKFKFGKYIGLAIILAVVGLNFSYFRPHDFLGRTDAYYLNRYIPVPVASPEYLETGEEYLRLSVATLTRPDKNYPLIVANLGTVYNIQYLNRLDSKFEVQSNKDVSIDYNKYLFPGWVVKVDGKKVSINAGKPFGQITFNVPSGVHSIEVAFNETPFRAVFDLVSLLGLATAVTIIFI